MKHLEIDLNLNKLVFYYQMLHQDESFYENIDDEVSSRMEAELERVAVSLF